jgi:hypothetical protein
MFHTDMSSKSIVLPRPVLLASAFMRKPGFLLVAAEENGFTVVEFTARTAFL